MDPSLYPVYAATEERHWWFSGRQEIFRRAIESVAADVHGPVLDVGCGTGGLLSLLRRFGPVTGLDISEEAVAWARQRGYASAQVGDARHLPFPDASFQLVAAVDLIEHFQDDQEVLGELVRVLRPGGVLFVTTAAFPWLWSRLDELGHHFRRYRRDSFRRALERPGLSIRLLRYYNIALFPPALVWRLGERLFPRRNSSGDQLRELKIPGEPWNRMLRAVLAAERHTLASPWPFGISLLSVSVKSV